MRGVQDILVKELFEYYYSGKILIGILLVTILVPVVLLSLLASHYSNLRKAEEVARLISASEGTRAPYSALKVHAIREPSLRELFNGGVVSDFPSSFVLSRITSAVPTGRQFFDIPFLNTLPSTDLRLIFQVGFSLIAIVFSFSAVSYEREMGTLGLLCANAIRKRTIIIAKILAGAVVLLGLLIFAHLVTVTVLLFYGTPVQQGFLIFLLLHLLASFLWVLLFFSLGLVASAATLSSARSIILLLGGWLIIVVIVPNLVPGFIARKAQYVSDSELYETLWPHYGLMFGEVQRLVSDLGYAFAPGVDKLLALQPEEGNLALSLPSPSDEARILYHSDGTLVIRTESEEALRRIEARLPQFIRQQQEVARVIHELKYQRFRELKREADELRSFCIISPTNAYHEITASLSRTDIDSFAHFVDDLNSRKEHSYSEVRSLPDFYSRRFFTLEQGNQGRLVKHKLWHMSLNSVPGSNVLHAWIVLLVQTISLLLVAVFLFESADPRQQ